MSRVSAVGAAVAVAFGWFAGVARAEPVFFMDDYAGFVQAAGAVQTIDFETLPDGSPSSFGVLITPTFNYTDQGVTFFAQAPRLHIVGNAEDGWRLSASPYQSDDPARNWIIADLVQPARAVGYFFGGHSTLSAFDADGALIGDVNSIPSGADRFIGVVSDLPISLVTCDRGANFESITSFVFRPVPEPGTLALVAFGVAAVAASRRHRSSR